MKISIIGTGKVAQALAAGFAKGNHEVTFGSRDPSKSSVTGTKIVSQRDAVRSGEVVVLAIPFGSVRETVNAIGPLNSAGRSS